MCWKRLLLFTYSLCSKAQPFKTRTLGDSAPFGRFVTVSKKVKRLWCQNQTSREMAFKQLKIIVFYCTLVSNRNIFTHLVTLMCISSYSCVGYWHPNNKSLKISEGETKRFCILEGVSVKKGGPTKFPKVGKGTKRAGIQDFLKRLEGGPT